MTLTLAADNPARQIPRPRVLPRVALLLCLVCAIVAASALLFGTDVGRRLVDRNQIAGVGEGVHRWVRHRPLAAPLTFVTLYVALSLLALPVWWLQVLAGYAFGLVVGVAWCLCGACCGSVSTLYFARWLGGEWIRAKAGGKMAKFNRLTEAVGHNGLLVVLAHGSATSSPTG